MGTFMRSFRNWWRRCLFSRRRRRGPEVRMATIVSALLQTSQDWDSGVPEHLQSLESSVAA